MSTRPTVGRVVHYRSHGSPFRPDGTQEFPSECRAAIVTEVDTEHSELVGLAVLNPTGQFFHSLPAGGCWYDEGDEYGGKDGTRRYDGGTWHWPEREA